MFMRWAGDIAWQGKSTSPIVLYLVPVVKFKTFTADPTCGDNGQQLQRLGLDVTNMAGGFEAWRKAGLPTRGSAAAGSLAGS
jgi:hypothetical protein